MERSVGNVIAWAVIAASFVHWLSGRDWTNLWYVPARWPDHTRYGAWAAALLWPALAYATIARRWVRSSALPEPVGRPGLYFQAFALYIGLTQLAAASAHLFLPDVWPALRRPATLLAAYGAPFAALAWPAVRGVSWRGIGRDLGLHSGAGWLREIGVGLFWFALLWTLQCALSIGLFAWLGTRGSPAALSDLEYHLLAVLFWAPVVEEVMFRGVLYRALRARWGWVAAGGASGLLFACWHSYWPYWPLHFVAGFGYAALREWRGSLVAPVVAHFAYNATVSFGLIRNYFAFGC